MRPRRRLHPKSTRREKAVVETLVGRQTLARFRQLARQAERLPAEVASSRENLQHEKTEMEQSENRTKMSATRRMRWTSGWIRIHREKAQRLTGSELSWHVRL